MTEKKLSKPRQYTEEQFALKRAEGQNEKNWLGKISIENISGSPRVPIQKREGWLSKFKL